MLVRWRPPGAAQDRTDSCRFARWSRPPRRPRGSPARCPSRGARGRARRASSRSAANQRRLSSGSRRERRHRHQPRHRDGRARDERVELVGRDARLALLAGDVHLDQDAQARARALAVALELAQRRVGGDRVDQPHVRHDRAHAPALQLADEVPLEQIAVRGHLRSQVLRAVLPDQADAGLGKRRQILAPARTWSRRAPRPGAGSPCGARAARARRRRRSPRARARGSRRMTCALAGRRSAQPCDPRLPARRARLRGGARRSARRRSCSRSHVAHLVRRRAASSRSRAIARRSMLLARSMRAAERARAPRGRPRSSRRPAQGPITAAIRARPPSSRSARTPSSSTPAARPAPAGVHHRDRCLGAERDRQAVGGQHHRRRRPASAGGLTVGIVAGACPRPPASHAATRSTRVPCTWRPRASQSQRRGARSSRVAGRIGRRSVPSPRDVDRLPSPRVVNSALAAAAADRGDLPSTRDVAPSASSTRLERGAQLRVALVGSSPSSLRRSAAAVGGRSPGRLGCRRQQVVAGDREAHVAQLVEPAPRRGSTARRAAPRRARRRAPPPRAVARCAASRSSRGRLAASQRSHQSRCPVAVRDHRVAVAGRELELVEQAKHRPASGAPLESQAVASSSGRASAARAARPSGSSAERACARRARRSSSRGCRARRARRACCRLRERRQRVGLGRAPAAAPRRCERRRPSPGRRSASASRGQLGGVLARARSQGAQRSARGAAGGSGHRGSCARAAPAGRRARGRRGRAPRSTSSPALGAAEADRDRVDREVPAAQVLLDRSRRARRAARPGAG